jgi:hypothetical protein
MGQVYSQPGSEDSLAQIQGWNWGAFLLNWIWAIGNNVWIGLIALIPAASLVMAIILGVKGNEWAWQSRKWQSVEQFRRTQAVWTMWAVIILVFWVLMIAAAILIPLLLHYGRGTASLHQSA